MSTIKDYAQIVINKVGWLAGEYYDTLLPTHSHAQHTGLTADDHLHYMTCAAGSERPFTGNVHLSDGLVLRGVTKITLDDHFRPLSAFTGAGLDVSQDQSEWTGFYTRFGTASLLAALNGLYDTGAGIVDLDYHALAFGDIDDHITGDATTLAWYASTSQLYVGAWSADMYLGSDPGMLLSGNLECTGDQYLYGGLTLGCGTSETDGVISAPNGGMQFVDGYCDWTVKPRLANSLAQYTALISDWGVEDSIFGYLHRLKTVGVGTLQTVYENGSSIAINDTRGEVTIGTALTTQGALRLSCTHADSTLDLLGLYSTAPEQARIMLSGDATGTWGHAIRAADKGSLYVTATGYDDTETLDGAAIVGYDTSATNEYNAYAMLRSRCSVSGSTDCYIACRSYYNTPSAGPTGSYIQTVSDYVHSVSDLATYIASDGEITITTQTESGTGDDINIEARGNVNIDSSTGWVHFGATQLVHARSLTYASSAYDIGTVSSGTLTVDWNNGPIQVATATASITSLVMTAPQGVCDNLRLIIIASGSTIYIGGASFNADLVYMGSYNLNTAKALASAYRAELKFTYLGSTYLYDCHAVWQV